VIVNTAVTLIYNMDICWWRNYSWSYNDLK